MLPLLSLLSTLLLLFGVLQVACAGEEQEARLRFVAAGWEGSAFEREWLEFTYEDGVRSGVVRGDELAGDAEYAQPHSRWFATATSGRLQISVTIRRPDGMVIGSEAVEIELEPDWGWELQAYVSRDDPANTCFGCAGSMRVTAANSEGDAVWLVWGGNRISEPVIY